MLFSTGWLGVVRGLYSAPLKQAARRWRRVGGVSRKRFSEQARRQKVQVAALRLQRVLHLLQFGQLGLDPLDEAVLLGQGNHGRLESVQERAVQVGLVATSRFRKRPQFTVVALQPELQELGAPGVVGPDGKAGLVCRWP